MTWVIGASSIFGYGTMLSDVRVTFADGRQADLIQKAYGVAPYNLAGFAGSIKIGFLMLESLSKLLVVPPNAPQPGAWEPEWVAEQWQPIVARIFNTADQHERAARSEMLLVGISQTPRPEVMANPRALKLPRVCIIRFSSPDFEPLILDRGLSVVHIGSGAAVTHYTKMMRHHFEIGSDSLNAETGTPGRMWPRMLGSSVARLVSEYPVNGVSPHVHILVCQNREIFMMTNDERKFPADGTGPIEFTMPRVATNFREFLARCRADHLAAEGATA